MRSSVFDYSSNLPNEDTTAPKTASSGTRPIYHLQIYPGASWRAIGCDGADSVCVPSTGENREPYIGIL